MNNEEDVKKVDEMIDDLIESIVDEAISRSEDFPDEVFDHLNYGEDEESPEYDEDGNKCYLALGEIVIDYYSNHHEEVNRIEDFMKTHDVWRYDSKGHQTQDVNILIAEEHDDRNEDYKWLAGRTPKLNKFREALLEFGW